VDAKKERREEEREQGRDDWNRTSAGTVVGTAKLLQCYCSINAGLLQCCHSVGAVLSQCFYRVVTVHVVST
jgi:hypothetical protein